MAALLSQQNHARNQAAVDLKKKKRAKETTTASCMRLKIIMLVS